MTTRSNSGYSPTASSPEELIMAQEEHREPPHQESLTAVAAEAAQSGVVDQPPPPEIPGEDSILEAGDPDVDPLDNEYSGEEIPGSTTPTPDQNNADDIGRAYGVTAQDSGAIRSTAELLERRDRHRWELDPASKDPNLE